MTDESGFFAMIDRLVATLPLDPERVGETLGITLTRVTEGASPAVELWHGESDEDGPFESVDLKVPGLVAESRKSLLSVQLRSPRNVTREEIIEVRGDDFRFNAPSPRYPEGSVPAYMTYDLPWGQLRFGVTVDQPGDLLEIILQADEEATATGTEDNASGTDDSA